jgi:hypothetical protein
MVDRSTPSHLGLIGGVVICRSSRFVENLILDKFQHGRCLELFIRRADYDHQREHGEVQQWVAVRPHDIRVLVGVVICRLSEFVENSISRQIPINAPAAVG